MLDNINNIIWPLLFVFLVWILNSYYAYVKNNICFLSNRLFKHPMVIHYFFFLGTVIHELSHALMSLLLGVKVNKIVPFYPQKIGAGYNLGYIEHQKTDSLRSTLIGIAPIIGCSVITYFSFIFAIGEMQSFLTHINNIKFFDFNTVSFFVSKLNYLFLNLFNFSGGFSSYLDLNWKTFLFIYIAIACILSGEPSHEDLKSIRKLTFSVFIISIVIGAILFLINNIFPEFRSLNFLSDLATLLFSTINLLSPIFMTLSFILIFQIIILVIIHILIFLSGVL